MHRPKSRFAHRPPNRSRCTEFWPSCKIMLTSRGDFAGPTTRPYSSMLNMAVQAASAGDAGAGIDRITVFRCERLRSSRSVARPKWSWPPKSRSRRHPLRRLSGFGRSGRAAVKQRPRGSAVVGFDAERHLLGHIECVPARVSTETSEFENGRAKSQAQTAAVHANLFEEPI